MSVYNGERYLRPAVESILGQTYGDFEFIVVDDGSTDGSGGILAEYAAGDGRLVVVVNEVNLGLTRSLNKGIGLARGRYIGRQDADDVSRPERLAKQVAFLEANPEVGLVGTGTQFIDLEGKILDKVAPVVKEPAALHEKLLEDNAIRHGSVVMRREWLAAVGLYDETVGPVEDYDLWLRLAEVTQVANLPEPLYQYRFHQESVSRTRYARQLWDKVAVLERALARRYGEAIPAERLGPVVHHCLVAAEAAYAQGQWEMAERAVVRALTLAPTLFGSAELVAELEQIFTPNHSLATGVAFVERVFAAVRGGRGLERLKGRLLGRLHMREVFRAAGQGDRVGARVNLWRGIRCDPSWLWNRGVLVLAVRSVVAWQ